ncbi:MAG: hypothetical protein AAFZ01_06010 [Pseudomonadota bacterium]
MTINRSLFRLSVKLRDVVRRFERARLQDEFSSLGFDRRASRREIVARVRERFREIAGVDGRPR